MPHPFLKLLEETELEQKKLGEVYLSEARLGPILASKVETVFGHRDLLVSSARLKVRRLKPEKRHRLPKLMTSRSKWRPEDELGIGVELSILMRGGGRVDRKQVRALLPRPSLLVIEGRLGKRNVRATFFPNDDNYGGELLISAYPEEMEDLLDTSLVGHSAVKALSVERLEYRLRSYWQPGTLRPGSEVEVFGRLRAGPNLEAFLGPDKIEVVGQFRDVEFDREVSTEAEWEDHDGEMADEAAPVIESVTMTEVHLKGLPRRIPVPFRNPLLEMRAVALQVHARHTETTDQIAPQIGVTGAVMLEQRPVRLWAPYMHDQAVLVFRSLPGLRMEVRDPAQLHRLVGGDDWVRYGEFPVDRGFYLREFSLSYHLAHGGISALSFTIEAPGPMPFQPHPRHFALERCHASFLIDAPQAPRRDVTVAHEATLVVDNQWRFHAVVDSREPVMVTAVLDAEAGVPFGALKKSPFLARAVPQGPHAGDGVCTEHHLRLAQDRFWFRTRPPLDDEAEDRTQRELHFNVAY